MVCHQKNGVICAVASSTWVIEFESRLQAPEFTYFGGLAPRSLNIVSLYRRLSFLDFRPWNIKLWIKKYVILLTKCLYLLLNLHGYVFLLSLFALLFCFCTIQFKILGYPEVSGWSPSNLNSNLNLFKNVELLRIPVCILSILRILFWQYSFPNFCRVTN